jgi:HSP20 family protein
MVFWEDPFDEYEKMRRKMFSMVRGWWDPFEEEYLRGSFPVDMEETEDELIVKAYLPGFDKQDVAIKATEDTIEISAQHKQKKIEQTEKMFKSEKRFDALRKSMSLPVKVEFEKAKADMDKGILVVRMPKKEKKKIGKEIKVE